MAYIFDASVAPFCHSQNHSGSVPISTVGVSAGRTPESSFVQPEPLVSRKALAARHSRVRGLNQHHLPASPSPSFNQFTLRRANRGVSSFAIQLAYGDKNG